MNEQTDQEEFVPVFPTHQKWQKDGPTLSFSEISTWLGCPYRHMLAYVKRINTFEENVHTSFGDIAHDFCESYLMTRHVDPTKRLASTMTKEEVAKRLEETWAKFNFGDPRAWADPSNPTEIIDWVAIADRVADDVGPFMDETFGNWQALDAEHKLFETIDGQPLKFKGYIDGVLVTTDKKGKEIYWLIDWKFTYFWKAEKKEDIEVQLQLILYKYFWSIKHGIPLNKIRCAFVLAKKKAKAGKTFELVPISVGPKTLEKGTKILRNMLSSVKRGLFLKKRMNCEYCPFKGTEHCTQ